MTVFKNLSDEDVLRIERGIAYSVPSRTEGGVVAVLGSYGDMSQKVRFPGGELTGEFFAMATDRLKVWFCTRIDMILAGDEFLGSKDWAIVGGKPVSPERTDQTLSTATSRCQGGNCHAGTHDYSIAHSLECQEETTYILAGQPQPSILACQKAVTDRWDAIAVTGHDSDCSTSNRGVPELLGPCDCSLSKAAK